MAKIFIPMLLVLLGTAFCQEVDSQAFEVELEVEKPPVQVESESVQTPEDTAAETLVIKSGHEIEKRHNLTTSLFSLLTPGLGEYRIGKKKLGKTLMVSDGVLLIGFVSGLIMNYMIKQDMRGYLYTYGDCNGKKSPSGRDAWDLTDSELELVVLVDSSAYYEERIYKPSRDDLMKKIDFYWQFDSEAAYQEFYDMWGSAQQAKLVGYYFLAGALVSRLVSFINTGRLIKKAGMDEIKKADTPAISVHSAMLQGRTPGLRLRVSF